MSKASRKLFVVSALAVVVCSVGPLAVTWAQDTMASDHMKMADEPMKMSDDQMKMAGDHMDKMKMMNDSISYRYLWRLTAQSQHSARIGVDFGRTY